MSPDAAGRADGEFGRLLDAYHRALRAGREPPALPASAPPGLAARLERAQAALRWLHRRRGPAAPRRDPGPSPELPLTFDPRTASGRLGRFHVLRELGRGAQGVVFLADDPVLGRPVALKVARAELLDSPELR